MATERGRYLAELDRSVDNIEMSLTHLARVIEAYQTAHPEISDHVLECGNALVMIADAIKQIRSEI